MARTGGLLCVMMALVCWPPASLRAESELAGGTSDSDHVGLGVFSRFPLNFSASVQGGYDDNVNTSTSGKQDSWFTTANLLVSWNVGTDRTQLTLSTTTGFTYYANISDNQYEPNLNLTMVLSHKVSPRLNISVQAVITYQTEPDFQYGLGANRRAGNYFYTTDSLGVSYIWLPRLATATTYSIDAVHYDDSMIGKFEDRISNTIGNQLRFLVWPTTNVVAEYRFQIVSYDHDNSRDSTTHFVLGGFDHAFGPRLSAVFRGGIEFRHYEIVGEQNSPYFEGTVNYKLGKNTAVTWSSHYGIEEGDVGTNPTRKSFRTTLQGKYDLTPRIGTSLSISYYRDDYASFTTVNPMPPPNLTVNPSFVEESFDINLALRYAVTRYLGLQIGYDHTEISSGQGIRDYSRNRVWGGLNVVF
jgi:hypothetical protein